MPKLLDLFCGAGGAAMGYHQVGFEVVGVDIAPQKCYPFEFIQADALEFLDSGGWKDFDAIHASPPCQGYSIMNNLPWLRGREYPLLILPIRERFEYIGLPWVIENVMGARKGAKGLAKRGLEAHGLDASWLCGTMFGKPFYRHRLFATPFLWLAPQHPKHTIRTIPPPHDGGGKMNHGRARDPFHDADGKSILGPGSLGKGAGLRQYTRSNGKVETVTRTGTTEPGYGLTQWQNSCQVGVVGMDDPKRSEINGRSYPQHAGSNWRLAAEAMEVTWCDRAGLTQAIPPCYTRYIGTKLLEELGKHDET